MFQRNFNKNLNCCMVVFQSNNWIDVCRQFGSRVIHEIRCMVLPEGGRSGLSTENQIRRERWWIDALVLQGK